MLQPRVGHTERLTSTTREVGVQGLGRGARRVRSDTTKSLGITLLSAEETHPWSPKTLEAPSGNRRLGMKTDPGPAPSALVQPLPGARQEGQRGDGCLGRVGTRPQICLRGAEKEGQAQTLVLKGVKGTWSQRAFPGPPSEGPSSSVGLQPRSFPSPPLPCSPPRLSLVTSKVTKRVCHVPVRSFNTQALKTSVGLLQGYRSVPMYFFP